MPRALLEDRSSVLQPRRGKEILRSRASCGGRAAPAASARSFSPKCIHRPKLSERICRVAAFTSGPKTSTCTCEGSISTKYRTRTRSRQPARAKKARSSISPIPTAINMSSGLHCTCPKAPWKSAPRKKSAVSATQFTAHAISPEPRPSSKNIAISNRSRILRPPKARSSCASEQAPGSSTN